MGSKYVTKQVGGLGVIGGFVAVGIATGEEVLVGSITIPGVDVSALVGGAIAVSVASPVPAIVGSAWQDVIDKLVMMIRMRNFIFLGI